jgi:hypothetical protein
MIPVPLASMSTARPAPIRNPCIANLGLSPHNPLSQCRRTCQKRPRNRLSRQSTHLAQSQRHLRIRSQRRMTTSKNQPQPIVFNTVDLRSIRRTVRVKSLGNFSHRRIEFRPPPHRINRLETAGRNKPRTPHCASGRYAC